MSPLRTLKRVFLPRTLMGRVFGVFAATLLLLLVAGLGMFYRYQYLQHIEETQDNALMLVEAVIQPIEESVVIGDYDTVKRTLGKMLVKSPFQRAQFLELGGGAITLEAPDIRHKIPPAWFTALIDERFYDVNRVITVGGKDYGVLRLSFDVTRLAAQLWQLIIETAAMASVLASSSLLLMRVLLRRWLDRLGGLRTFEHDLAAGLVTAEAPLHEDAPLEIQEAILAVNRGTASLRVQYGEQIELLMNSLVQHKSAMDQAAIVSEIDVDGRITVVNAHFIANSGLSRDAVVGQPLASLTLPGTAQPWAPCQHVWQGDVTIAGRDRALEWHRTIVPMFDGGVVERYICIDIDITERKAFERTIVANARRENLIAALGRAALASTDLDHLFQEATETAAAGLGVPGAALFVLEPAGAERALVLRAGSGALANAVGFSVALPRGQLPRHDAAALLLPLLAPLGAEYGVRSSLDESVICTQGPFGMLAAFAEDARSFGPDDRNFLRSIAHILATTIERHSAQQRLTYLAQYDALTDLPNRRFLAESLDRAIDAAAAGTRRTGVMFIDLDHFKKVNDMLGHGVGDQLLVLAAKRLQACARPGDLVARLGGDEFALILPDMVQDDDIATLCTAIIDALAAPFVLQGQQLFVSASIGIARYPQDGVAAEALLKNADTAMYAAKNSGRGNFQFFSPAMHDAMAERVKLEAELHQALERREFLLHYQPKLDLASGKTSGFEALLRWQHPQRGLVPPADFIAILEDTGLIIPVGEWVVQEVCRQLGQWHALGFPIVPVAINLSARQLEQGDLAATIERIVVASGIAPALLEFELTESMLMVNPDAAVEILGRIKAMGMRLSIDDFGTGYSSLAYLKRFPLDALKIDRTFVRDLPHDSDDAAITRAVINLAHSLNLKVVAEGVENSEQLCELKRFGCDEIQGYYVDRPLAADRCFTYAHDATQQPMTQHTVALLA
ncbi:EAL domain-containing protein [Massilia aurea]|uniref:putative bifunctional diguanylate cyclase/phosphodiesterase n=1 Tax=Massilia aurea TaxID=373040 RepID=UPI003461F969